LIPAGTEVRQASIGAGLVRKQVVAHEEANNEIVDFSDNGPVLHLHQYGSIMAK